MEDYVYGPSLMHLCIWRVYPDYPTKHNIAWETLGKTRLFGLRHIILKHIAPIQLLITAFQLIFTTTMVMP